MSTLVRKNLIVDDAKLKKLARKFGLSESATVRELIDNALMADDVGRIFRELQKRGGIDDVFGKLGQADQQPERRTRRPSTRAGTNGRVRQPTHASPRATANAH